MLLQTIRNFVWWFWLGCPDLVPQLSIYKQYHHSASILTMSVLADPVQFEKPYDNVRLVSPKLSLITKATTQLDDKENTQSNQIISSKLYILVVATLAAFAVASPTDLGESDKLRARGQCSVGNLMCCSYLANIPSLIYHSHIFSCRPQNKGQHCQCLQAGCPEAGCSCGP